MNDNYVHPLIGKASANMAIIDIYQLEYLEAYDLLSEAYNQFDQIQAGLKEKTSTPELQRKSYRQTWWIGTVELGHWAQAGRDILSLYLSRAESPGSSPMSWAGLA